MCLCTQVYMPFLYRNQLLTRVAQKNGFTKVSVHRKCVQGVNSSMSLPTLSLQGDVGRQRDSSCCAAAQLCLPGEGRNTAPGCGTLSMAYSQWQCFSCSCLTEGIRVLVFASCGPLPGPTPCRFVSNAGIFRHEVWTRCHP